jgi:hypothetical protein
MRGMGGWERTLRRSASLAAGRGDQGTGRGYGRAALVDEGIFVQGGNGRIVLDIDVIVVDVGLVMQFLAQVSKSGWKSGGCVPRTQMGWVDIIPLRSGNEGRGALHPADAEWCD